MDKNIITVCATCHGKDIVKTFANSHNVQVWLKRTGYELIYIQIHKGYHEHILEEIAE